MDIYRMAPGQVIFQGTNFTRRMALDRVRQLLEECGIHPIEAEGMVIDNVAHKVALAWWTDEHGFVQEHHEGAIPVTVVSVGNDERVFARPEITRQRNISPGGIS